MAVKGCRKTAIFVTRIRSRHIVNLLYRSYSRISPLDNYPDCLTYYYTRYDTDELTEQT